VRALATCVIACAIAPTPSARAAAQAVEVQTLRYASPGGTELLLDLYRPTNAPGPLPVIVFVHGGGWSAGTRTTGPDFRRFFARDGFAMASLDYRLTPAGVFPRNVEDVKTAVRFLRKHAAQYGLDAERICLWGTSAGGHLAAVAALAPRGSFEGTEWTDVSSAVRCVLDAYGPTGFTTMDEETRAEAATLHPVAPALASAPPLPGVPARGAGGPGRQPHDAPASAESRLVGAAIQSVPERVREASPITYASAAAPPFLIMHGLADDAVPHRQSERLYEALAAAGAEVELRLVDGLPHTFFNRTELDELAGPFRMTVRTHPRAATERTGVDRAGVFDVARAFFVEQLRRGSP
jgi:acetyl esterase/lipase